MSWKTFLESVRNCAECKSFPKVRAAVNARAWNDCELPDPRDILNFGKPRVFFISEAPPGGGDRTFFYRNGIDTLRERLFEALELAGFAVSTLQDFNKLNCYLLPSFCYPCASSTGANSHPNRTMVEHSASTHLRVAIDYMQPSKIVLLGESAVWAARAIPKPCFVTYWPTKRFKEYHQRWHRYIVPTLRAALTQDENDPRFRFLSGCIFLWKFQNRFVDDDRYRIIIKSIGVNARLAYNRNWDGGFAC